MTREKVSTLMRTEKSLLLRTHPSADVPGSSHWRTPSPVTCSPGPWTGSLSVYSFPRPGLPTFPHIKFTGRTSGSWRLKLWTQLSALLGKNPRNQAALLVTHTKDAYQTGLHDTTTKSSELLKLHQYFKTFYQDDPEFCVRKVKTVLYAPRKFSQTSDSPL